MRPMSLLIGSPRWLLVLVLFLIGAGCAPPAGSNGGTVAQTKSELTPVEGLSRYALAQPVSYGNVSLVPIIDVSKDRQTQPQDEYVSLTEAKKNGWIQIQEVPGDAEVNSLEVTNTGTKSILLLAGELLLGGQQDRIVAKDTVVPPGKAIRVPVFCVEPHRWEGPTMKFDSDGAMVPQKVRKAATYGDQTRVWNEVGEYNNGVVMTTGAARAPGSSVRGGLSSKEVQARISADLPKFQKDLAGLKNIVGFVYVLNGEVQTAELFGDTRLFEAGRDGLLRGFLADAAVEKTDAKAKVSMTDCARFFQDAMGGKRNQTAYRGASADWSVESDVVAGVESTKSDAKSSSPSDVNAGGFLHGTYSKSK